MILSFKNGQPFVEGVSLNDILQKIETPFYIYSQKKIIEQLKKLKTSIDAEIFYSVKANSNQAILSLINSFGVGVDTVSAGEIERAIKAGIPGDKIIFEGVGKSTDDIKYAINNRIRQINIESLEELTIINAVCKSINEKIDVGVRINPDINAETHDKISTGRKTDKFGITFDLILDAFKKIQESEYLNLVGISTHIGSQINDINVFEKLFIKIKEAIKILNENNLSIKHLDLGGGFGISYKNEKELNLKKLNQLIHKYFDKNNLKISVEPGRFLVAKAGILVTKILNNKVSDSINYLITDAGMNTFIRPAMYDAFHKIISLSTNNEKKIYTVAGPICESSDILGKDIELPKQKIGNYLVICDTGAYGFTMSSNYNSRSLPSEILVYNKKYEIIRKEENFSATIEKDLIPSWLKN